MALRRPGREISGRNKQREVLRTGSMATGFSHQERRFRAAEARARSVMGRRGKRRGQGRGETERTHAWEGPGRPFSQRVPLEVRAGQDTCQPLQGPLQPPWLTGKTFCQGRGVLGTQAALNCTDQLCGHLAQATSSQATKAEDT